MAVASVLSAALAAEIPRGLTCEYRDNPVGIDVARPRLSWLLPGHGANGVRQTAYRVRASHRCPYGLIRSEWKREEGMFSLEVEIPPNTEATVCLPSGAADVHAPNGVEPGESRKGRWTCRIGSGIYVFTAKL